MRGSSRGTPAACSGLVSWRTGPATWAALVVAWRRKRAWLGATLGPPPYPWLDRWMRVQAGCRNVTLRFDPSESMVMLVGCVRLVLRVTVAVVVCDDDGQDGSRTGHQGIKVRAGGELMRARAFRFLHRVNLWWSDHFEGAAERQY